MAGMKDVWGFQCIRVGGGFGVPSPGDVHAALCGGARDRGITDVTRPAGALDASRDVIIDDVLRGRVGDLRPCDSWDIADDALLVVWDGAPISMLEQV